MAPIQQGDTVVAMVWVPPLTGVRRFAEAVGTPLVIGVLFLLIGGTAIAALVVFRPAQARLRAVEDAARRFGEGDLTARAPAVGGDEVTAVAEAFNRMAADLAARRRDGRGDRDGRQCAPNVLELIRAHGDQRLRRTAVRCRIMPPSKEGSVPSR